MGKASRWLRNLLGSKKQQKQPSDPPNNTPNHQRWGFIHSFREKPNQTPPPLAYDRKGSSYREMLPLSVIMDEEEQCQRAIAVAAATAAVAEAAVAAANAAAAVVRLTQCNRSPVSFAGVGKRGELAAVKIQSVFRGYLARRALRALKGLVKLQALVRGNIVRKQAAETLRCMQALVRVQARARACRALQSERSFSERRAHLHAAPQTPEKDDWTVRGIDRNSDMPSLLQRNPSKPAGVDAAAGWNWLDKWMEEKYWESREATRTSEMAASVDDETDAKILEVDPGKPQFIHLKRGNHHHSSCSAMPETPLKDSAAVPQFVPSPSPVDIRQCTTPLTFNVDSRDYADSPQLHSASSRHGSSRKGPFTPSKSDCSPSLFGGYSGFPNYMAKTESYCAKVRSQSAPKQRPELEKSNSMKRAPSSHGTMQNPSTATPQKSSSLRAKFANKACPGSGRLDRLGMPIRM